MNPRSFTHQLGTDPIHCRPSSHSGRHAFTLVEMLVTISIIAVLLTLAIGGGQQALRQAQQTKCASRVASWTKGIQLYAVEHDGRLPAGWCNWSPYVWQLEVAPYMGIGLYTTRSQANTLFQCPSITQADLAASGVGAASYAVNEFLLGSETSAATPPRKLQSITMVSSTVLMGDSYTANTDRLSAIRQTPSSSPGTVAFRHYSPKAAQPARTNRTSGVISYGEGRANIAFCDGHVESLLPEDLAIGSTNNVIWNP